MSGLPAPKSGVNRDPPNEPPPEAYWLPVLTALDAPEGLAATGRLTMLKISQRAWMPYRSLSVKFLKIEKSTFLKPESRKMFRPMLPKVPSAGGTRTELPFADT